MITGLPLLVYLIVPSPEPWRTVEVGLPVVAWIAGTMVLAFALKRDFTPVRLAGDAIHAGFRAIPYVNIARIDQRSESWLFRVVLTNGKEINLSTIGISEQTEFFEELKRRIRSSVT